MTVDDATFHAPKYTTKVDLKDYDLPLGDGAVTLDSLKEYDGYGNRVGVRGTVSRICDDTDADKN